MAPMLGSEVQLHKGSTSMFVDMQANLIQNLFFLASCMCQPFSHGVLVSKFLYSYKKLMMEHLIVSTLSATHFNLPKEHWIFKFRYIFISCSMTLQQQSTLSIVANAFVLSPRSKGSGAMFDFDDLEDTAQHPRQIEKRCWNLPDPGKMFIFIQYPYNIWYTYIPYIY